MKWTRERMKKKLINKNKNKSKTNKKDKISKRQKYQQSKIAANQNEINIQDAKECFAIQFDMDFLFVWLVS